eukprot:1824018-Rhodomonas_salina.1
MLWFGDLCRTSASGGRGAAPACVDRSHAVRSCTMSDGEGSRRCCACGARSTGPGLSSSKLRALTRRSCAYAGRTHTQRHDRESLTARVADCGVHLESLRHQRGPGRVGGLACFLPPSARLQSSGSPLAPEMLCFDLPKIQTRMILWNCLLCRQVLVSGTDRGRMSSGGVNTRSQHDLRAWTAGYTRGTLIEKIENRVLGVVTVVSKLLRSLRILKSVSLPLKIAKRHFGTAM